MTMRLVAICPREGGQPDIPDARALNPAPIERATLLPGVGLAGNPPPKKPDRELSLLAAEALPGLRERGGLCTGRFHAELIVEGVDFTALSPGDTLRIGAATITLVAVGKRCFDDCPLRQRGETCPLPRSCAFARVTVGGAVAVGDAIVPEADHA